jgi:BolA protein
MNRIERMENQLRAVFTPSELEVIDESHQHIGHAGARDGRGHFRVRIRAEAFANEPLVKRHRLIYDSLGEMMETDLHALSIKALAPGE